MKMIPKIFFYNINEHTSDFVENEMMTRAIKKEIQYMGDSRSKLKIDRYEGI